jgi:hypothetical protein
LQGFAKEHHILNQLYHLQPEGEGRYQREKIGMENIVVTHSHKKIRIDIFRVM